MDFNKEIPQKNKTQKKHEEEEKLIVKSFSWRIFRFLIKEKIVKITK